MNKRPVAVLLLMLGLSVIAFWIYFNSNNKKVNLPQNPTPSPAISTPPVQVLDSGQVEITKNGFVPETISIKRGALVTWTNSDTGPHQVASDPHPLHTNLEGFDSEEALRKDESFSFTLEKSGTFTYHDHLNPNKFKGTVIVE